MFELWPYIGLAVLVFVFLMLKPWRHKNTEPIKLNKYKNRHIGYYGQIGLEGRWTYKSTFRSVTGKKLRSHCELPKPRKGNGISDVKNPKGVVIFCPGFASHLKRAATFAQRLSCLGFATYGIDYPGYGGSEGIRGYIEDYREIVHDIINFTRQVKSQAGPSTPFFIAGQSTGGSLAICCAIEEPKLWTGMILLAPATHTQLPTAMDHIIRIGAKFFPKSRLLPIPPWDMYSRNLSTAEIMAKDVLMVTDSRMYLQTSNQIVEMLKYVRRNLDQIITPLFIQHGKQDLVYPEETSRYLMANTIRLPSSVKVFHSLPLCFHDLLHEPEYEELIQSCIDFLEDAVRKRMLQTTLD